MRKYEVFEYKPEFPTLNKKLICHKRSMLTLTIRALKSERLSIIKIMSEMINKRLNVTKKETGEEIARAYTGKRD